jgi:hypothetical protein
MANHKFSHKLETLNENGEIEKEFDVDFME